MAFLQGPTFDLDRTVLNEAEHLAGVYNKAKLRGCTIIVDNASSNLTLGPGVSYFKPRGSSSFGTPCAGAFLRPVEPGRAQSWASHACGTDSGTCGFIKYPIEAADGLGAGHSLFIYWNVPGPEGYSMFAQMVAHLFQGSTSPAWCAAFLPSDTPDAQALERLWNRRVLKRPAHEAQDLVTSDKFNGIQLSGTMACAPGADNFDFRVYVKSWFGEVGFEYTSSKASNTPSKASSNAPHAKELIGTKIGNFGVCVDKTVYALHEPSEATFDIVFIHGLQFGATESAWLDTWSCQVGGQRVCWPVHFLTSIAAPLRFEYLRILSVTYNADAIHGDQDIGHIAGIQANSLRAAGVGERPVVFVGHSLGGLVMKQLISVVEEYSRSPDEQIRTAFTRFYSNMRGMVFYGTPHSGAPLADSILTALGGAMLPFLQPFNAQTADINHRFESLRQANAAWQLRAFAESKKTRLALLVSRWVVPAASALPAGWHHNQIVPSADHFEVCRATNGASLVLLGLRDLLQTLGAS